MSDLETLREQNEAFRADSADVQKLLPYPAGARNVVRVELLLREKNELLRACEWALFAFETNSAIDWNILEHAIRRAGGASGPCRVCGIRHAPGNYCEEDT